jgi:hypothetical protein
MSRYPSFDGLQTRRGLRWRHALFLVPILSHDRHPCQASFRRPCPAKALFEVTGTRAPDQSRGPSPTQHRFNSNGLVPTIAPAL